jgi:hypothetical protein
MHLKLKPITPILYVILTETDLLFIQITKIKAVLIVVVVSQFFLAVFCRF